MIIEIMGVIFFIWALSMMTYAVVKEEKLNEKEVEARIEAEKRKLK